MQDWSGRRSGVHHRDGCGEADGALPRETMDFFRSKWRFGEFLAAFFSENLGGTICISVRHSKFWGARPPCALVIYAHA